MKNEITRFPPPPDPSPSRTTREGLAGPALLLGMCLAGIVAILAAVPRPLAQVPAAAPAGEYTVAAQSITPITALNADTTGAILVSADRIDIWARTSSGDATLNLVEYLPDDSRWAKVGADCAVSTDLKLCRYVAKRGARYWHVYKASGTMAYVGVEALTLPAGASLGSIEPATSTAFVPVVTKITSGSGSWTPTAGATIARVVVIGGGGAGGSGRKGGDGSSSGGGGGGGGAYSEQTYRIADLTTPVSYSVGAGNTGGASRSTNSQDGATGGSGSITTFGTLLQAAGGFGGAGGSATSGTAGAAGSGQEPGGAGGAGTVTGAGGNGASLLSSRGATGGGGGAGGLGSPTAGGNGGSAAGYSASGVAGATAGSGNAGSPGVSKIPAGYGGGGGSVGGAGGDGGGCGGGGGGGGGGINSVVNSGAGGAGASGCIWIFESHLRPANDNAAARRMVA